MSGKTTVAGNGVHLHHLIVEIFVLNLRDQKTDFTGTNLHNLSVQVTARAGPFSVDSG